MTDPRVRFEPIVAQASVGIAQLDREQRITFANDAYGTIAGRPAPELGGQWLPDLLHADDRTRAAAVIDSCFAGASNTTLENRYLRADGSIAWVEDALSALRGADGTVEAVMVVSHDISRRKAVETSLADAEERYRLIGRATNDVIWDWDRRTGLVVWHLSLHAVFGFRPEEATGPIDEALAWWSGHIHPDEREGVLASFMAAAQGTGETWGKEYRFQAADGSYRQVIDRGYIQRSAGGGPVRMIGSMQDVTGLHRAALERERLLTALEGEHRTLETILQHLPAGVIVAEPSGRITFANPQVERIWRHPVIPTSSVADYAHWKGFHPDGRPLQPEEWPLARALVRGEVVSEQTIRFERGDGGGRGVMQVSASPILDGAGRTTAGVVVFSDITERERAYELTRAAQLDAEAASRMKDEFLAVLSHELRTPLNAVLGWAHVMRGEPAPPERVRHAFDVIHRNARLQAQMVEDLLDVSAIIRGTLRLTPGEVDVRAIVQAAVDAMRIAAEQKPITLEAAVEEGTGIIEGDAARLQQVVANLVGNAVKFTPAGGRVSVEARRVDGGVQVVVRDTGEGIAPEFLPHVFERFRQGDASPTRRHGGLGLGLSIARHLAEAHGGTLSAESDGPGKGATFTLTLPKAQNSRPKG